MHLEEVFTESNWDGKDLPDRLVMKASNPSAGLDHADALESWLAQQGLVGVTGEETSEQFHQNLVGVEGWLVDFQERTFTRLDDFNVRWLTVPVTAKTRLVRVASYQQLNEVFMHRHGSVVGK
jgi:hypothetical protein